jgi:hypothetical protein
MVDWFVTGAIVAGVIVVVVIIIIVTDPVVVTTVACNHLYKRQLHILKLDNGGSYGSSDVSAGNFS